MWEMPLSTALIERVRRHVERKPVFVYGNESNYLYRFCAKRISLEVGHLKSFCETYKDKKVVLVDFR